MQRIGDHGCLAPDTASVKRSLFVTYKTLTIWGQIEKLCKHMGTYCRSISRKLPKTRKWPQVWVAMEDLWLMSQLITCQILDSGVGWVRSAHGKGLRRTSVSPRCLKTSIHHSSLGDGRTNMSHKSPLVSFKLFSHSQCHKDFTSPLKGASTSENSCWVETSSDGVIELFLWFIIFYFREAKLHHLKSILEDVSCLHEVIDVANFPTQGKAISVLKIQKPFPKSQIKVSHKNAACFYFYV